MTNRFLTALAASLPASVPFTGPEALERRTSRLFRARLGANESGFGPSPRAIAAMQAAARDTWMYGDPEVHDLRHAIARHHGISPAHVMVGEGIDGLLGLLVRLTIAPGDAVVTSEGAYPTFNFHVAGFGGTLHKQPYRDDHEDIEGLVARAEGARAKLLYLSNPDNPMGTWQPGDRIAAMAAALPAGTLLILDEAYVDLAPPGTAPSIDADTPGVIRMRTFSKGYGLAGLRVGYAIAAPDLIAAFDAVRNHFGLGRIAQAGALAALADQDWLSTVRSRVAASRERIAAIARDNGLVPLPSATNFVTMDCGRDGAFARRVLGALQDLGVFVRMPGTPPLDRAIRVSCGPDDQLAILAEALPRALEAAST